MKRWIVVVVGVLSLIYVRGASATQLLPLTADDLSLKADVVFVGTCLTRTPKEGPLVHTEYTFKIDTVVKGTQQPGSSFTFRQWGSLPGATKSQFAGPRLLGMPSYEPGQSYMLFLGGETSEGFRAPVGLGQGVFRVMKAADGSTIVQNELGNRFLYPSDVAPSISKGKAVATPSHPSGPLHLNDFIQSLRKPGVQP